MFTIKCIACVILAGGAMAGSSLLLTPAAHGSAAAAPANGAAPAQPPRADVNSMWVQLPH